MKLVMTLLVRDEADVLEQQLAFSFAAGVDFVVATDHGSSDGTTEILERYVEAGVLLLYRESGAEYRQAEWVTRMARVAASELEADWVINSDADEFWWPCGGGLKDVLARLPGQVGVVGTLVRVFPPRDGDGPFHERMDVRFTPAAPVNDPTSPFRVNTRLVHRASPTVCVGTGNAGVSGLGGGVRAAAPIDVLHFPIRGLEHFERKFSTHHATLGRRRRGEHVRLFEARRQGTVARLYEYLRIDSKRLERGLDAGSLAVDTRLRDALRRLDADRAAPLRFSPRTLPEDVEFAVEASVLHEGEAARLCRRLDELALRV
jgi:Glycosyl transferase family 2